MEPKVEYERWCANAVGDEDIVRELADMAGEADKTEDAFYRELAFGTGGLRGVIGAGTNRMNIYTVAKASQGLADYINKTAGEDPAAAISYDSRIKSDVFARVTAEVFAANGIRVWLYPRLMPTPCLSFAVRQLKCAAGVMITASHNPAKYNGYKVYGADGCQITTHAADMILREIQKLDVFADVKRMAFETGRQNGMIQDVPEEINTAFAEAVKSRSMLFGDEADRNVSIVYSPLNGTGREMVLRALKESGFGSIAVVKEQEWPDGYFPTCPYPNPEIQEAMALGLRDAEKLHADLVLATDPDCDRAGIAVRDGAGAMHLLTGNETGLLLLDYICSQRLKHGAMPEKPVLVKTIVTTDMAERIAEKYGVETVNVLTGFKFIGEKIGELEKLGHAERYIFGFEESYGYLSGSHVRDKDAVNAAFLICEMFAFYKARGVTLWQKLNELYAEYGCCLNTLHSYTFEGAAGFETMQRIMADFRGGLTAIGPKQIVKTLDYLPGLEGLPKSDVLKFLLEGGCSVVVRPSGTEPKLKAYFSISADRREEAEKLERTLSGTLADMFTA